MRYFYNKDTNGFYIKGINTYIPNGSVEITEEYYNQLMQDLGTDDSKTLSCDKNNMPIVTIDLPTFKQRKIEKIKREFKDIISSPIDFKGKQFAPKDIDVYVSLIGRHEDTDTYDIWDCTDNVDNILSVSNKEVKELIKKLTSVYEKAYQDKKIKIAQVKIMTSATE